MTRGRPRIESVKNRKWFTDSVEQVEQPDAEWDHLIWTGESISKYSAPKVTSQFGGTKNVRRVLWAEAFGELPPIGKEVVPNCGKDDCISPRHAELITQAEAATARAHMAGSERKVHESAPWLYKGADGSKWGDFTEPYGQSVAVAAHAFACIIHKMVYNENTRDRDDMAPSIVVQSLPDRVRAEIQRNWEDEEFGDALVWVLTSLWIRESVTDCGLLSLKRFHMRTLTMRDDDDSSSWVVELPEPIKMPEKIQDPVKNRSAKSSQRIRDSKLVNPIPRG